MRLMKKNLTGLILSIFLMSGCQSPKPAEEQKNISSKNRVSTPYQLITKDPWVFIQNELQIEIPTNQRILSEKKQILASKISFEATLDRSEPYIYYIINELNQRKMPVELALIPLIESAYNPLAKSYANAAGLWQIAPITAKQYGLMINRWYDSRRDLIQSTDVAINLLQDLNQRFDGDWLMTLAAYNAGEGRVKKAIAWNKSKGLPTHFWALNLSKETMNYIPKFLATVDIIRHNQQYDITLPSFTYSNSLVRVDLSKQISLDKIADYSGIPLSELLEFNAGYLKKEVKGPYHLFIPSLYAQTLYIKLKESGFVDSEMVELMQITPTLVNLNTEYSTSELTNNKYLKITDYDLQHYAQEHKRYSQIIYSVKPGDNLSSIAENHKVKTSELVKWNKIKNANKLKPGDKLTIEITN